MRMILRLDADFTGMPGGDKVHQHAMRVLYEHLQLAAESWPPEYGGANLQILVGFEDSPKDARHLLAEIYKGETK